MAASLPLLSTLLLPFSSSNTSPIHPTMLTFLVLLSIFILSLFSFSIFIFSRKLSHPKTLILKQKHTQQFSLDKDIDDINRNDDKAQMDRKLGDRSDPTLLTRSILLEVLPADSTKWAELFRDEGPDENGSVLDGTRVGDEDEEEEEKKKKRKKRGKKKRPDPNSSGGGAGEVESKNNNNTKKEELVCLYPFTTSSSAVQRKLKQQYDQLVKSHESNGLTLDQVGQFVNCLVEAKKELKNRSEVIQRKFTIAKALLLKADRSSFERLRQQIYKLELEQRRLEEDAFVYNWLQQQLKVSPAYKKHQEWMFHAILLPHIYLFVNDKNAKLRVNSAICFINHILEIGACMEAEDKRCEEVESADNEFTDISFEELLAQEKKDAFWQRNGKTRSSSVSGHRFC